MLSMKKLKQITEDELLELFSDDDKDRVVSLMTRPEVDALVVFQNKVEGSPHEGRTTAIAVGSTLVPKTVMDMKGAWIYEGDEKQEAVSFCLTD